MRLSWKKSLALLLLASSATALRSQNIQIKLVDGKTGRAVRDACVGAWMKNASTKTSLFIPVDKDGVAHLRLTRKDSEVEVSYDPKLRCGGAGAINPVIKRDDTLTTYSTGFHPSCAFPESMPLARWKEINFSTDEVIEHGVASANTCGKVTIALQPGTVILFVRPRNHREKMYDWRNSEFFPF